MEGAPGCRPGEACQSRGFIQLQSHNAAGTYACMPFLVSCTTWSVTVAGLLQLIRHNLSRRLLILLLLPAPPPRSSSQAVDALLAGGHPGGQVRERTSDGSIQKATVMPSRPGMVMRHTTQVCANRGPHQGRGRRGHCNGFFSQPGTQSTLGSDRGWLTVYHVEHLPIVSDGSIPDTLPRTAARTLLVLERRWAGVRLSANKGCSGSAALRPDLTAGLG